MINRMITARQQYKHSFQSTKNGMTLIEVMVIVTIMAVLIIAFMTNLTSFLQRARDGERKADLKKITTAMEQYYNDWGGYPLEMHSGGPVSACGNNTVLSPYLKDVPCDPHTHLPYAYLPELPLHTGYRNTQVHKSFRLLTELEYKADPELLESGCEGSCGGGVPANSLYNYGVAVGTELDQGD